jgi:hypothetical protein
MDTVTVFHASAVPREELGGILADHLALERLRVFRRLLVVRFARAIAVIFLAGAGLGWLPRPAWLASVVVFSGTGASVWLAERRRERHLNRRLQGVPGASAQAVVAAAVMTVPDGRQQALYRG